MSVGLLFHPGVAPCPPPFSVVNEKFSILPFGGSRSRSCYGGRLAPMLEQTSGRASSTPPVRLSWSVVHGGVRFVSYFHAHGQAGVKVLHGSRRSDYVAGGRHDRGCVGLLRLGPIKGHLPLHRRLQLLRLVLLVSPSGTTFLTIRELNSWCFPPFLLRSPAIESCPRPVLESGGWCVRFLPPAQTRGHLRRQAHEPVLTSSRRLERARTAVGHRARCLPLSPWSVAGCCARGERWGRNAGTELN